jgi:hypothetical protein
LVVPCAVNGDRTQIAREIVMSTSIDLDAIAGAYVRTALWTATNGAGEVFGEYDTYGIDDLDPATADEIRSDVATFVERVLEELGPDFDWEGKDPQEIGHNLYLTQAHHGAGFWDGDWQNGAVLTRIAQESHPPHIEIQDENGERWFA